MTTLAGLGAMGTTVGLDIWLTGFNLITFEVTASSLRIVFGATGMAKIYPFKKENA